MGAMLEELDYRRTEMGELILRRRRSPSVPDDWVYEVKLDDEMLMSSTVNASECALAELGVKAGGEHPSDVLVGGLGLGYTAVTALGFPQVRRLDVVEYMEPVIGWHRDRLVPMAARLMDDPRCTLIQDDFFEFIKRSSANRTGPYDVVLLDIDHSPESWLHERHAQFYTESGLKPLVDCLVPNGVFALWSADVPGADFLRQLKQVFDVVEPHTIRFFNPHIDEMDTNWIVVCTLNSGL
ncbi:MAG TPA: spermidine synthase [Verrucomicrobia bacterium]|jgi:spermidine synthase|nr:spermidine synthase [Verrucomicrobiota bacterium]